MELLEWNYGVWNCTKHLHKQRYEVVLCDINDEFAAKRKGKIKKVADKKIFEEWNKR